MSIEIVLLQPEQPGNAGAIGRTCLCAGAHLHMIRPFGFHTDEKSVRRAGLDYWHMMTYEVHANWDAFRAAYPDATLHYATTKAPRDYCAATYGPDDFLVFGRETKGLDEALLAEHYDRCIRIPMRPDARSLNLSNSGAIVLYEALRQQGFPGLSGRGQLHHTEVVGGEWKDYV